jgi:hypothetical protein
MSEPVPATATPPAPPAPDHPTVRDLRRHWKPTKERTRDSRDHDGIRIRIHRCCSWLQRVEEIGDDGALDAALIFRWIALNSLYGRWDEQRREPLPDRTCLPAFLDRVMELDADGRIVGVLDEHRKLVMAIFDEEHLARYFWEDPGEKRARKARKTYYDARTWYQQGQHRMILGRLAERIYFLRCQIVHGGSTFRGGVNRTPVKRCNIMLGHLIPPVLLVMMDHGVDADWGPICYPPHERAAPARGARRG